MSTMSRTTKIALGAGLGLVVLVVAGLWFGGYFSSEPEEQTIEDAVAAIAGDDADAGAADEADVADAAETAVVIDSIDGTWTVAENPETFVGYRINEVFTGGRDFEAVGRTAGVTGTFVGSGTVVESVEISADLTGLESDSTSRDGQVRRVLGTSENPTGTFVLTSPIDLGSIPAEGETVRVDATGDLTVNGVTQSVTFPLDAAIQSGLIVVVGQIEILLSQFDVETPSAPIVASVEDNARVEVSLLFEQS